MKAELAAVRTEYEVTLKLTGEEWINLDRSLLAASRYQNTDKTSASILANLRNVIDDAVSDVIE